VPDEEFARIIGKTTRTVRRYRRHGLPSIRTPDGKVEIDLEAGRDWMLRDHPRRKAETA
jgi:hypothetical protein